MSTYNHAPYVAQSIRSVLDQTFSDFEFLIVDDGSRDETPRIVAQFTDPRISFAAGTENRGSAARRSELIERSRGTYIAVQNSDDVWRPDKLGYQFAFLESHPEIAALFGRAALIDANGGPVTTVKSPFDQDNRSSGRWLRRFFEKSNCLCHPTVLLRRSCHVELGGYDPRFRQIPDMQMWVRLCKKFRLFQSDNELASMRWHGSNASDIQSDPDAHARLFNEHYLIASEFFDDVPKDLLVEGFGDLMVFENPPSAAHREIETALIYLKCESAYALAYRVIGVKRLHDLLGSPDHRAIMAADYGIDHLAFQRLSAQVDTFRQHALLAQQIAQRDHRIAWLEQQIAPQLAERERRLDRRIARFVGSTLKRVTKPFASGSPLDPPQG
jgi:glycosyltransferase involved in cell wall biosynthesis